MITSTPKFLLVDDDPLNNFLSKIALKKYLGNIEVKDFVVPEEALEYIETEFVNKSIEEKTTLFLDINMPTLTGWEFLDKFKNFSEPLQKKFNIYILSSSIDPSDIERAKLNPFVIDFIENPLDKAILTKIFD
jgi:CheY-like chemotaxis protein